jgi:hypothetical protein
VNVGLNRQIVSHFLKPVITWGAVLEKYGNEGKDGEVAKG